MVVFMISYGFGMGPIPNLMVTAPAPSPHPATVNICVYMHLYYPHDPPLTLHQIAEVFPTQFRTAAVSLGVSLGWLTGAIFG